MSITLQELLTNSKYLSMIKALAKFWLVLLRKESVYMPSAISLAVQRNSTNLCCICHMLKNCILGEMLEKLIWMLVTVGECVNSLG